ncbi:alpha-taxilin-like isoform X1 [Paramormyrops kingsleyae]|uniref:Taxilin gamma n=3 Tax=Paramormyrops kingsleyae TaxID=1676925 RepID=A0A3B3SVC7_9TELE|nr:gamma-taxilin-like isoform X3 [Paramormyrops kingsleyae]
MGSYAVHKRNAVPKKQTRRIMDATEVCGVDVLVQGLSLRCSHHSRGSGEEMPSSSEDSREETSGHRDLADSKKPQDKKELGDEVNVLMDALNTLSSSEEKLAALCKKYADLLEESRGMQKQMKGLQKQQAQMVKEKAQLQGEHSKAVLARSKLENRCRELQRHNRALKEENTLKSREYDERRKEATLHFQATLSEIEEQMEQHSTHNTRLQQENLELADKLKKLVEQYELREEQVDSVFKQKDEEQQLLDSKLQKTTELLRKSEEKHLREIDFLLKEATESRHLCELMKEQESQLKQQLSFYMDKFEDFQSTLSKSNEMFTAFRQEMEKMTKKIKKLEKETTMWRGKWESSSQAVLQMAEEKTLRDRHYASLHAKLERLERLCRALQKERNDLTRKVEVQHGPQTEPGLVDLGHFEPEPEDPTAKSDPQPSEGEVAERGPERGGVGLDPTAPEQT